MESYALIILSGQDDGYLATVQMGTPPQNFTVLVDSGSADFWVGSEACLSEQGGCVSLSHYSYLDIFITNFILYNREITFSSGHNPVALSQIHQRAST